MNFSSWPPQQEQHFVVFEQYRNDSSSKAMMVGLITGVAMFVIAVGVYFGFTPERKDLTKDMNMSNLSRKKSADAPAPTPSPAPAAAAPAPAPAAPAEAAPAAPAAAPASK